MSAGLLHTLRVVEYATRRILQAIRYGAIPALRSRAAAAAAAPLVHGGCMRCAPPPRRAAYGMDARMQN